jgi:microcystin-dependent protein
VSYANMDGVPTQSEGVSEILASDWNTFVRDNFDSIKFGHVTVADDTAKSALNVAEGTMVYQLDNQKVFVYSGSAWVEVADLDNASGASDAVVASLVPTGVVNPFAGSSAPTGWLLCNGDAVPNGNGTVQSVTANFSALFAALGTSYGTSGSDRKLPDLQGRMVVGKGTHSSVNDLGKSDSTDLANRRPAHSHTASTGRGGTYATHESSGASGNSSYYTTSNSSSLQKLFNSTGMVVGSSGGTTDSPSFLTLNYIIKY